MKLLPLGAIVIVGLVSGAAACNFIYSSQLKDYGDECKFDGRQTACGQCIVASCTPQVNAVCLDRYSSTLGYVESCATDPNASGYSSYDPTFPCDTFAKNDAGPNGEAVQDLAACIRDNCTMVNGPCSPGCAIAGEGTCSVCINQSCGDRLLPVCSERGSGSVYYEAQECADHPEVSSGYCENVVEHWDGGIVEGAQEPATLRNNFRACVRMNCLSSDDAGCRTCPVVYTKATNETYDLFQKPCGSCIVSYCYSQFMSCCSDGDCYDPWIRSKLAACAFTETLEQGCQDMFAADSGTPVPLADCLRANCKSDCNIP